MDIGLLVAWLRQREGIAHRADVLRAGMPVEVLRELVRRGGARMIRRQWVSLPEASRDLVVAAHTAGRLSCTSLARRRGWWMPEAVPRGIHVHVSPKAGSTSLPDGVDGRLHWSRPLAPSARTDLRATVEDALAHIAVCLPHETALILWESASKTEKLSPETLRGIPWSTIRARELAASTTGLSDSGIETDLFATIRSWRVPVRQQVKIAGHRVDLLIGDWLVVQADGFEFHSTPEQRSQDIAHDAELRLRGHTVLRFSYHQIVRDSRAVEEVLRRAIAQGLHLHPSAANTR